MTVRPEIVLASRQGHLERDDGNHREWLAYKAVFKRWILKLFACEGPVSIFHPQGGKGLILVVPAKARDVLTDDVILALLPVENGRPVAIYPQLVVEQYEYAMATQRFTPEKFPPNGQTSRRWADFMTRSRHGKHGRVWVERFNALSQLRHNPEYIMVTPDGSFAHRAYLDAVGIRTLPISHHSPNAPDGPTNEAKDIAEFILPFTKLAVYVGTLALGGIQGIELETFDPGRLFFGQENLKPADRQPP